MKANRYNPKSLLAQISLLLLFLFLLSSCSLPAIILSFFSQVESPKVTVTKLNNNSEICEATTKQNIDIPGYFDIEKAIVTFDGNDFIGKIVFREPLPNSLMKYSYSDLSNGVLVYYWGIDIDNDDNTNTGFRDWLSGNKSDIFIYGIDNQVGIKYWQGHDDLSEGDHPFNQLFDQVYYFKCATPDSSNTTDYGKVSQYSGCKFDSTVDTAFQINNDRTELSFIIKNSKTFITDKSIFYFISYGWVSVSDHINAYDYVKVSCH